MSKTKELQKLGHKTMNKFIETAFWTYTQEEKAFLGSNRPSENKKGFKTLCKIWDEEVAPHFPTASKAKQAYRIWLNSR